MTLKTNGPDIATLVEMLRYRRPHNSKSERKFINRFLRPLGAEEDDFGNLYLKIGDSPRVLWSAHTDSVHRTPGKQRVVLDGTKLRLATGETSNCLGADNAAGVWILREMIFARVPGLYIFHRLEESGGQGSEHFATHNRHLLDGIEAAIAFDRRNTSSIITHQWGGRTASDAFAKSLAKIIGMGHKPDDGGTFTDTASYQDLIPECTNVSVGFSGEHSAAETLDLDYIYDLRQAMVGFDESQLIIKRDPTVVEPTFGRYSGLYGGYGSSRDDYAKLRDLCKKHPDEVADFLEMMSIDPSELEDHIWSSYGYSTYQYEKM